MRKLPRKKPWASAAMLQKNNRGTHGLEPMNNFKLGSLMQKHELKEEIINDFDESEQKFLEETNILFFKKQK